MRIKEIRKARGLTQRELAELLGTTSGVVSRWENYPSRVNIPTLTNLAKVLDCSPADLLCGALVPATTASEETVVNIQAHNQAAKSSPFDLQYLSEVTNTPPNALVMVEISTDAMMPTFMQGDFVMVDTTVKRIVANGLYCLRIEDLAAIRRVAIHPATRLVAVSCDNPAYEILQDIKQEKLDMIGRVIWRCGKV